LTQPGRRFSTVSSRLNRPSAISCITATATKDFVMLPTHVRSDGCAWRSRLDVREPRGGDVTDAVLLEDGDDGRDVALRDDAVRRFLELALRRGSREGREDAEQEDAHTTSTRRARGSLRAVQLTGNATSQTSSVGADASQSAK
jgi:hypothetical protein